MDIVAVEGAIRRSTEMIFDIARTLRGSGVDVAFELGEDLAERFADDGPNPEQLYAGTELGARMNKKLGEISPLLRTAFWLREIEGLSAEEAANVLGVSRNTLKARLWRARQELAARLGLTLDTNLAPAT